MSVAIDGTTTKGQIDNTTQLTVSHTATGSNRAVIVGVNFGEGDSASTCSATYGGTAMTKLGVKSTNNQTGLGFAAMFGLVAPATGAQNVVINGPSGAIGAGVTSFTGVDQTTPFGTAVLAAGSKSGGTGHPTASVTSATGDVIVDALCYGSFLTGGIGNTGTLEWNEDVNQDSAAGNGAGSSYSGSSTVTVGYNPTPDDFWGLVAVDVKAVAGGSTINGTATIASAGTVTAKVVESVTAAAAGAGSVTANVTLNGGAAVAGAGALTAPVRQLAGSSPTGAGVLSSAAVQSVTAAPAGAGAVTANVVQSATASLTGAGAVTAVGSSSGGTGATLAGAGVLSAKATLLAGAAPAGAGVVTALVTQNGKATIAGAGAVTAAGVIAGAAALTGAGTVTSPVRLLAGASLTGAGVLTAGAGGLVTGSAALVGLGVLSIDLNPCVVTRPNTGTTSFSSGLTTRPDSGETDDPCTL